MSREQRNADDDNELNRLLAHICPLCECSALHCPGALDNGESCPAAEDERLEDEEVYDDLVGGDIPDTPERDAEIFKYLASCTFYGAGNERIADYLVTHYGLSLKQAHEEIAEFRAHQ